MAGFTADLNPKVTGMSLAEIMKAGAYGAEMDVLNRQAAVAREKEKEMPSTHVKRERESKKNLNKKSMHREKKIEKVAIESYL